MDLCLLKISVIWLQNFGFSQNESRLEASYMGAKALFLTSPKLMIGKMCPDKNGSDVSIIFRWIWKIYKTLSMNAAWCKFDVENKGKTFHHNVLVV